jgi:IS5 family transposase
MKPTKKGNQRHFGMKAHIGADAGTGMVHSLDVTAANVSDLDAASKLIRPDDEVVNGDAGYAGIEERKEVKNDEHLSKIEYRINKKKGADKKRHDKLLSNPMKHLDYIAQPAWDKHIEYMKSKVRCKVEHAFAIIKNKFGYRIAVYRGLEKNKARLYMLFCSANLLLRRAHGKRARKQLVFYPNPIFSRPNLLFNFFYTVVFMLGGHALKTMSKSAVP